MEDNKLITYSELCNLGHFVQFSGTHETSTYINEWKPNSTKIPFFAIIAISHSDKRSVVSTPMVFNANSVTEKRRIYTQVSTTEYTECDVIISFNWEAPQFILHSVSKVISNTEFDVTKFFHIGWLYVGKEY